MLEWATAKTFQRIQFKWSFDDTFRLYPSGCLPKSYLHLTGEVRPVKKGHVTHHQLHLGLSHQAKRRLENGCLALSSHFLFTLHLSFLLLLLLLYYAPLFCHLGFFRTFFSTLFFLLFLGRLMQMLRKKRKQLHQSEVKHMLPCVPHCGRHLKLDNLLYRYEGDRLKSDFTN